MVHACQKSFVSPKSRPVFFLPKICPLLDHFSCGLFIECAGWFIAPRMLFCTFHLSLFVSPPRASQPPLLSPGKCIPGQAFLLVVRCPGCDWVRHIKLRSGTWPSQPYPFGDWQALTPNLQSKSLRNIQVCFNEQNHSKNYSSPNRCGSCPELHSHNLNSRSES